MISPKEAALAHVPNSSLVLPNLYQEERSGDFLFPDASSQIVGLATAILAREGKVRQAFLVTDCSSTHEVAVAPRALHFIRAQFEGDDLPKDVELIVNPVARTTRREARAWQQMLHQPEYKEASSLPRVNICLERHIPRVRHALQLAFGKKDAERIMTFSAEWLINNIGTSEEVVLLKELQARPSYQEFVAREDGRLYRQLAYVPVVGAAMDWVAHTDTDRRLAIGLGHRAARH